MSIVACPHCSASLNVAPLLIPATIGSIEVTLLARPEPPPVPVPIPPPDMRVFQNGVNIPWKSYGNDVGNPTEGVAARLEWWDTHLAMLAGHGVKVARTWIFPKIQDSWTRAQIGSTINQSFVSAAQKDLDALLNLGQKHDIRFELTLLDGANWQGGDIVTVRSPMLRQQFVDNIFRPVFAKYAGHPFISGIDALNEPEWGFNEQTEDKPHLTDFFQRVASACRDLRLPFTIGWGTHEHGRKWNILKRPDGSPLVDYYEFHGYISHDSQFPNSVLTSKPAADWNYGRPIVIGEFANDPAGRKGFLEKVWGLGFAGAWAWSSIGDAHKIDWAEYDAFARNHVYKRDWRAP